MIKKAIFTVIMLSACLCAGAQGIFSNEKNRLKQENTELKKTIDSLKQVIEGLEKNLEEISNTVPQEPEAEDPFESLLKVSREDYSLEVSDSLLREWYMDNGNDFKYDEYNLDSVKLASDIPDEVYIERLRAMNSFIPLPYNDIVRNYIVLYTSKRKTMMSRVLGQCSFYMPIFEETFNRYKLPEELKALAIIESAFNPTAESRAGARGMWQFMYTAGKRYGLRINSFVDERFNFLKETEAAAQYLRDHYAIFGDWSLTIASYNCGAGNVMKAMRRSGGKKDFWDIYPYLPRETRGYVPAFVAALYTLKYYNEHGIVPAEIKMPAAIDTVNVKKMMHFKQASEVAGIPMDVLKNLNPEYVHDIVPGEGYSIKLPAEYIFPFIDHEDSLYRYQADSLFSPTNLKKVQDGQDGERIVYVVKSGDSLGKIASKYRCSVAQLKRWNNLKSDLLRVGQRLSIYRGGKR